MPLQAISFLKQASNFAADLIQNGSTGQSTPTVVHEHYHWGGWNNWGPSYYAPVCSSPRSSSSDQDEKNSAGALIFSTIISVVCAVVFYHSARNYGEWTHTANAMSDLQEKHFSVKTEMLAQSNPTGQHKEIECSIDSVYRQQMRLLAEQNSRARSGFFWKVLMVSSGVALATGTIGISIAAAGTLPAIAATSAACAGGTGFLGSATAMLWRSGTSHWEEKRRIAAAKELYDTAQQTLRQLA